MSGCNGCKYIKNEIGSYPCNRCICFNYYETDITQSENKVEIRVGDVIQYSDSTSEHTRFGKVLTIYDNIKNPYKLIVEVKELKVIPKLTTTLFIFIVILFALELPSYVI